jgi:hypothetical protein
MGYRTDTAGENVVAGNVCYRKSDGKLWKAKGDAEATMPACDLAMGSISADGIGNFALYGKVHLPAHGLGSSGSLLYVSAATAGLLTSTLPSTPTNQVQVVGQVINADDIFFMPNLILIEVV